MKKALALLALVAIMCLVTTAHGLEARFEVLDLTEPRELGPYKTWIAILALDKEGTPTSALSEGPWWILQGKDRILFRGQAIVMKGSEKIPILLFGRRPVTKLPNLSLTKRGATILNPDGRQVQLPLYSFELGEKTYRLVVLE